MTKPVRILLVDDHLVVRKGIQLVLETSDEFLVVGEAENGEQALALSSQAQPDIVLMDIQMEGMNGIETTRALLTEQPSIKVIALSTFANRDAVAGMIEAGARGYLLKDVSANDLTSAILRISTGEILLPEKLYQDSKESQAVENENFSLGTQQKRVLTLMTKGFTNPEIAKSLGISTPTARYHVSAILQKLEVSKRSEAVSFAIRMGIVDYNVL